MRRTYYTLNDYEMQYNTEVGLFTRPSSLALKVIQSLKIPKSQNPSDFSLADVAQVVEQLIRNQQVRGSSPRVGSNNINRLAEGPCLRLFFCDTFVTGGFFGLFWGWKAC